MPDTVRIIDDDQQERVTLSEILSATEGTDAVRPGDNEKPEVAVLDKPLPGVHGDTVLRDAGHRHCDSGWYWCIL